MIGQVTELFVDNIDAHPYHHHIQPYQIVALGNDSDAMNAWWRVRPLAKLNEVDVIFAAGCCDLRDL